jgi:hypothetical protein
MQGSPAKIGGMVALSSSPRRRNNESRKCKGEVPSSIPATTKTEPRARASNTTSAAKTLKCGPSNKVKRIPHHHPPKRRTNDHLTKVGQGIFLPRGSKQEDTSAPPLSQHRGKFFCGCYQCHTMVVPYDGVVIPVARMSLWNSF